MEMTVEEIIEKEQEISRIFQTAVDTHVTSGGYSLEELYCDDTEMIEEELERCRELADFHNRIVDTMSKYQMMQTDYEARLNADMVAMLTELKSEIDIMSDSVVEDRTVTITSWKGMQKRICDLIQSKIDKLKADQEGGRMIETPFIAHSELTNEIYIVVGKEKYLVTEQAIKAVMAIKALEYEQITKNDLGVGEYVSKQAVLNKILKFSVTDGRSVSVTGLWTEVYALPSVTPQEPRWIPVSERLPNDNRKQLVYTKYGTYDIATYRKNKKEWMVSNEIDTYICGVIAWTPLPEPYKAAGEET